MSQLRPYAMAIHISAAAALIGSVAVDAVAEPLDKESCAKLQIERKQLFNADMKAALNEGPDWVKKHLNVEAIGRVRRFLQVEELIQFRCRGGGVARPPGCPCRTANPSRHRLRAMTPSLAKP